MLYSKYNVCLNQYVFVVATIDPAVRVEIERDFFEVALNSSVEIVCRYSSDFPNAIFQWRRTNNLQLPQQAEVHIIIMNRHRLILIYLGLGYSVFV